MDRLTYGVACERVKIFFFQIISGGGEKKIPTQKLSFSDNATSKCGSLDNAGHVPGGGDKKVMFRI